MRKEFKNAKAKHGLNSKIWIRSIGLSFLRDQKREEEKRRRRRRIEERRRKGKEEEKRRRRRRRRRREERRRKGKEEEKFKEDSKVWNHVYFWTLVGIYMFPNLGFS